MDASCLRKGSILYKVGKALASMQYKICVLSVSQKSSLDYLFLNLVLKKKIQITTVGMSDFNVANEVMCKYWVLWKREIRSTHLVEE